MNKNVFIGAVFIAIIAASAAYGSPVAAASNIQNSQAPQQNNKAPLTIAPSLRYEINGSLYAWVDLKGYALITTNLAGYTEINVTIRQLYLGIRVWLTCTNITVDSITGQGSADVTVGARIVGKVNIYLKIGDNVERILESVDRSEVTTFPAKWLVPWGTTDNFSLPMPSFGTEQIDQSTANPTPELVAISKDNITSDSIVSSTVRHVQFNFDDWLMKRINNTINDLWEQGSNATAGNPQAKAMELIPRPYPVTTIGRIDLWKANATVGTTQVPNILLMAGALVNLLIKWDWVGEFGLTGNFNGHQYTANVDINLHANFGVLFTLSVTTEYFRHKLWGSAEIATFTVQVPENATLTWRKVGVVVYYGSPAHGCDVTGGKSQGYYTYQTGDQKLFFVDYGWDGTPDFATNGTGTPIAIHNDTKSATISGNTATVVLNTKGSPGTWVYFNLDITGYTNASRVTRSDGQVVNATQYWVTVDEQGNRMLYVCDDPAYSYTIDLTGGRAVVGLTDILIIGVAVAAAVVVVAAVVLLRKRSSKPNSVAIK